MTGHRALTPPEGVALLVGATGMLLLAVLAVAVLAGVLA